MTRTIAGIIYTRRTAESHNWADYGKQARADVDFLLAEVDRLNRELEQSKQKEAKVHYCDAKCWQEGDCTGACGLDLT